MHTIVGALLSSLPRLAQVCRHMDSDGRGLAATLRVERIPTAELGAYCRRRARDANRFESWDVLHVRMAGNRAAHVAHKSAGYWVRRLLYNGHGAWLRERRTAVGSPSAWAGRLALRFAGRSAPGGPMRCARLALSSAFPFRGAYRGSSRGIAEDRHVGHIVRGFGPAAGAARSAAT